MFYDYSALAFYHKLPPPLPIMEKEEVPNPSWKRRTNSRVRGYRSSLPGGLLSEVDPTPEGTRVPDV
jgi:hypothetical protein